jgi:quercetin dioxygenase-like cupin family protein
MRTAKLSDMTGGWFVGSFEPTLYKTGDVEVAVKSYKAGDYEDAHYHKIATEISLVVSGIVEMNGVRYGEGDIIIMDPGDATDFLAVTDAVNTVVKIPGASNDKYLVSEV